MSDKIKKIIYSPPEARSRSIVDGLTIPGEVFSVVERNHYVIVKYLILDKDRYIYPNLNKGEEVDYIFYSGNDIKQSFKGIIVSRIEYTENGVSFAVVQIKSIA